MSDGRGCKCFARFADECVCGVDWTPRRQIELERENAELRTRLAEAELNLHASRHTVALERTRAEEAERKLAEAEQCGADAARREAAGICKGVSAAPSSLWEEPECWAHAANNCQVEILARIGQKV